MMPYGDTWRIHRKLFHRFFNVAVIDQHDEKIEKAVNVLLRRLSESPERFLKHVHLYVGHTPFHWSRAQQMRFDREALPAR